MCEGGRSDVNSASERDIEECVLAAVVVVRSLNPRIRMVSGSMVTEWIVTEWVGMVTKRMVTDWECHN